MHVAIGIGTLLLGSWVLNSAGVPPEEEMPAAAPVPPPSLRRTGPRPTGPDLDVKSADQPRPRPRMSREEMYRASEQRREQMQRNGQNAPTGMMPSGVNRPLPTPPTELGPLAGPGMPEMPTPPTQGGPAGQPGGAQASNMPNAPTYQPPSSSTRPNPNTSAYAAMMQQREMAGTTAYRSYAPPPPPEKVYVGTQVPTSGVSPYMQLFRNDTAGGTIDNYTTWVRPQLQQQHLNQQFGTDLFGLQRDARIQQASVQRMQNIDRSLQGVSTPQFGGYGPSGYGNPSYGGGSGYGGGNYGGSGYGGPYGP